MNFVTYGYIYVLLKINRIQLKHLKENQVPRCDEQRIKTGFCASSGNFLWIFVSMSLYHYQLQEKEGELKIRH